MLSGHLDGTINRFIFATETSAPVQTRIARIAGCVPCARGEQAQLLGRVGSQGAGLEGVVRMLLLQAHRRPNSRGLRRGKREADQAKD